MRHHAILFLCTHNTLRSVIAENLLRQYVSNSVFVESAGLAPQNMDPFTIAIMQEKNINVSAHKPRHYDELADQNHDLIIALSEETFDFAKHLAKELAVDVEFWSLPRPPSNEGSREIILENYRLLREEVDKHILNRFGSGTLA